MKKSYLWLLSLAVLVVAGCAGGGGEGAEASLAVGSQAAGSPAGKKLFEGNGCIACHGPDGAGDGPLARTLKTTPRNLSEPTSYRGGTSEIEIAETLRTGISSGGMPSYAHIPVEDRLEIARYLISLQQEAAAAASLGEEPVRLPESPASERKLQDYEIGGDFTLTDQNGEEFRMADTNGSIRLLFFGYTTCPDFCPMTLSKIRQVRKLLGEPGEEILTLFVSVDPERDTPEKLAEYLGFFDLGQAVGLTGTREEVDSVVHLYAAAYEKVETDTAVGYLVNHTTYLFLIDRKNVVRAIFNSYEEPEHVAMGIRVLLREQPPPS